MTRTGTIERKENVFRLNLDQMIASHDELVESVLGLDKQFKAKTDDFNLGAVMSLAIEARNKANLIINCARMARANDYRKDLAKNGSPA